MRQECYPGTSQGVSELRPARWLRRVAKRASQASDLPDSISTQGNFASEQRIFFQAGKGSGVQQEARSRRAWYKLDSASKRDLGQGFLLSGLSFRCTEKIKRQDKELLLPRQPESCRQRDAHHLEDFFVYFPQIDHSQHSPPNLESRTNRIPGLIHRPCSHLPIAPGMSFMAKASSSGPHTRDPEFSYPSSLL